ncbi:low molecular weight protein-tyrosine-phosphatase [Hankyongella ginsenosidimutans]|uniref:low molecular weight protein-tyrosine-phosphatase n=1 Tax=Hankyongella ginsenosidimutans TaxID=1763828 RepID=UPI001FE882B0|nr:low molecular weight protein-tyrosine-phosphatase [Hankyongella ginsenosidimutans]
MRPLVHRVLFVCLGNICRSPLAEGVFAAVAQAHGLTVHADSAGTGGWHVGRPPDRRSQQIAERHGLDIGRQRARQIEAADFTRFDMILAMDEDNLRELECRKPAPGSRHLGLFLDFAPELGLRSVPDPYYGDLADFEHTYRLVHAASEGLARRLAGL